MVNRLIVTLVGIMLIATQQVAAMDTPSNMRLEDVRGPFRAMCERCAVFDWSSREQQRYGKAMDCACKTVYGNRVHSRLWLRACKNGTVFPNPRTGKLQCLPDVSFTVGFNRFCDLKSDVTDGSKIFTHCWDKPAKSGFALRSEIDLIHCGGMNGPPRQFIVDANGLYPSC